MLRSPGKADVEALWTSVPIIRLLRCFALADAVCLPMMRPGVGSMVRAPAGGRRPSRSVASVRAAGRHSLPAASEVLRIGVMEVGTSSAMPAGIALLGIGRPPPGAACAQSGETCRGEKWKEEIPPVSRFPYMT
jgi:hypothetical protein